LERALDMVGLRLEHVRLVVCTHAHADHYGQAATIVGRTGSELWMHPNHRHLTAAVDDPDTALARRIEVGRSAGVPEEARQPEAPVRGGAEWRGSASYGVAGIVEPDRHLVDGVVVDTDLGQWHAVETPGHAPSHVCLWQPERRLLISGDHLLGRVSLYYDFGYTPDPVGEFMHSLDIVETLDARLALSGHARPFTDLPGHLRGHRELVERRLAAVRAELAAGPRTAYEIARAVYGETYTDERAWLLAKTLCWLTHLKALGQVSATGEPVEHWSLD